MHGKGPSTVHDARMYGLYELQAGKPLDIRLKDPYPSRTLFYNKQGGVVPKPRYFREGREIILVLYVLEE